MAESTAMAVLELGPADAGLPMTLEEFEAAEYERGYRYELIHGVLIVTPIPHEEERDLNDELGHWLRDYKDEHEYGKTLDLTLPEQNVRIGQQSRRCDRAIWAGLGRRPDVRAEPPTIIVEFTSARAADRRRDYQEKRADYLTIRIKEYWIIDRFDQRMLALVRKAGRWVERSIEPGQLYETPILPGFKLDLAELLGVIEEDE